MGHTHFTIILLLTILLLYPSGTLYSDNSGFEIKVDPRIELLAVMQSLTKWADTDGFTHLNFQYYKDVKNHFGPYKNHQAVKWLKKNLHRGGWGGWNYDAPPRAMLHLSNPPEMKVIIPFSEYLLIRGSGEKNLNLMVGQFNEFAQDSNFMEFWESHKPFYEEYVNRVKGLLPFKDYSKLMMEFYGEERSKFVFVTAPLFHGGGYGAEMETEDGKVVYYFGGPQKLDEGFPIYTEKNLKTLVFHEFGHSFVSPAIDDFKDQLNKYAEYFKYIKVHNSYGSWELVCEEHLVRTCESLLLRMAGFPEEAERDIDANINQGFVLMPFFLEKMESYLQNRDLYPTFRSFFPEILNVLEEVTPVKSEGPTGMGIILVYEKDRYRISDFDDRSPIKKAGIKKGDRLLKINGVNVTEKNLYQTLTIWRDAEKGQSVQIVISRKGKSKEFDIKVPFGQYYKFVKK